MNDKLQLCPAGHQAEYDELKPDGYSNPGTPSTRGIKCNTNCIWSVGFYRTKAEAAAAWNRPPDPRVTELEHLANLLAVIHRDGGHYQSQHGTEKAVAIAMNAVLDERTQLAAERTKSIELQERIDSLTKQSQIIESDRQIACMELDAERAKVEKLEKHFARANPIITSLELDIAAHRQAIVSIGRELVEGRAKVERLMADIYFLMRDTNCQCEDRKEQGFSGKCSYCGVVDAIAFVEGK